MKTSKICKLTGSDHPIVYFTRHSQPSKQSHFLSIIMINTIKQAESPANN